MLLGRGALKKSNFFFFWKPYTQSFYLFTSIGIQLWLAKSIFYCGRNHCVVFVGRKCQCVGTILQKWAIPGLFLLIFVLFKHKSYRKTVGFSGIRTRIIRALKASTLTTWPPQRPNVYYPFQNVFGSNSLRRSGGRQSSVDPSAPTILQPWARIPSTTSTLFSVCNSIWMWKGWKFTLQ